MAADLDGRGPITRDRIQQQLDGGPGYAVLRAAVPDDLREQALRRLNLEIARCGLSTEQLTAWKDNTFWPTLRGDPDIVALRGPLDALLVPADGETWAETQILLRFPDEAGDWPIAPHVDRLPDWAEDRRYRAIVGVALSPSLPRDGCLVVWPGSHRGEAYGTELVPLDEGDVVVMHPQLGHSSTLNRGGHIRYVVYFRLLGASPAAAG